MKRIVLVAIALTATAACADTAVIETAPSLVSPREAVGIIDSASSGLVLLDVRTPAEYAEGHIAGSTNIDFYIEEFADEIAALDRDAEYVVYCRSGNRSGQTVELMQRLGFTNVTDVDGGIVAWQAAGLPIER